MKRFAWILLGVFFVLTGCAQTGALETSSAASSETSKALESSEAPSEESAEANSKERSETVSDSESLIVFAAASLQETLDEIGEMYGRPIEFNFDSSGTLKTQIEEGAECDAFISAAPRQINELEEAGLLKAGTERNILENKVALAVSEGNPADITGFEDLAEKLKGGQILLAVGNSDVPVGQYTQEIFEHMGLDEQELSDAGVLSYGTNVKEVTTQVSEGSVAAGIIYSTDAYSAGLETVAEATPEMCGQVIYPGAVLENSAQAQQAEEFLDYLTEPDCVAVFEKVGFVMA